MAGPVTVIPDNWAEFVRFDAEQIPYRSVLAPTFYFRGQAREDWPLEPTLTRIGRAAGWTVDRALQVENELLHHFIAQAHLHLPSRLISDRNHFVTWWVVMQHYGAPTRMLDWTQSLFVATYFAVQQHLTSDGAVWMFDGAIVEAAMQAHPRWTRPNDPVFLDRDAPACLDFPRLFFQTDRMVAQQTVLTLSRQVLADHGTILESAIPEDRANPRFIKIVIRANLKLEFMQRLRRMNITASALFPGIDGIGRSIDELAKVAGP